MSLRHDLRNVIIMRNTIYAGNKFTEERVMFSRQFCKSSSFFDAADSSRVQLDNKSRIRSSDRWLGRSEGEEIDENCL